MFFIVLDLRLTKVGVQRYSFFYVHTLTAYLVEPEIKLNYGYGDFLLLPDKARYPEIAHSYILELKYVKLTASDAEVEAKSMEADEQLQQYANDKIVKRLCNGTQLHLLKVIFRGAELAVCMAMDS